MKLGTFQSGKKMKNPGQQFIDNIALFMEEQGSGEISVKKDILNISLTPVLAQSKPLTVEMLTRNIVRCYVSPEMDSRRYALASLLVQGLIENALYYTSDRDAIIHIETWRKINRLNIKITNRVSRREWNMLKNIFGTIFASEADSMYIKKVSEISNYESSPLMSLMKLKNDYNIAFNFSVFEDEDERMWLTMGAEVKVT